MLHLIIVKKGQVHVTKKDNFIKIVENYYYVKMVHFNLFLVELDPRWDHLIIPTLYILRLLKISPHKDLVYTRRVNHTELDF